VFYFISLLSVVAALVGRVLPDWQQFMGREGRRGGEATAGLQERETESFSSPFSVLYVCRAAIEEAFIYLFKQMPKH